MSRLVVVGTVTVPEKTGWPQLLLFLFLAINYCMVSMNHALPTFHGYTPPFHCQAYNTSAPSEQCVEFNNLTTDSCPGGYTFDTLPNERPLVVEWQLVCERRMLLPLAATLYFCGVTLGAVLCGMLADRYGRRPIMLACLFGQALLGVGLFFSTSLIMFIVLRVIQGFCVQGMQGTTYTLLMELFASRTRTAVGVILEIYWALGLIALAGCSYLIPDWRYLQLTLATPTMLTLFYTCVIPESPLWLTTQGKLEEAQQVWNKLVPGSQAVTIDTSVELSVKENSQNESALSSELGTPRVTSSFLELLRRTVIRKHIFVMTYIWFSVSLSYYGVMFYLPALSGERHINFLFGSLLELAAYIVGYWVLARFGRRMPLCIYLIASGVICVAVGGISIVPDGSTDWNGTARTVLTLSGKTAIVSAFCTIFLYTAELFPTVLRAAALGLCGFWSRVGSLISPQLLLLGEYTSSAVPMVCMGVLCLVSGAVCLTLPETLGQPLPDTIQQAQELSRTTKTK